MGSYAWRISREKYQKYWLSNSKKEVFKFVELVSESSNHKPSFKSLITFEVQKVLALFLSGIDKEYWVKEKWIDKSYLIVSKINIFKRILSYLLGRIIQKKISKSNE